MIYVYFMLFSCFYLIPHFTPIQYSLRPITFSLLSQCILLHGFNILTRFKVLEIVAHPGSLYYIQEVRAQVEPFLKNVVRTTLG